MRPSRRSLTSGPVQSTTVDGLPAQTPASSTTGTSPPKLSASAWAVVSGGWPWWLALVVAYGPAAVHSASGTGWSGLRTPTVSSSSPRSAPRPAFRGMTIVRAPGQ